MKSVASLLAGTALAVTMLLGGVVVASAVFVPADDTPRFTGLDVKDLWTTTPVQVHPEQQAYERLPPRYGSQAVMASAEPKPSAKTSGGSITGELDLVETGAVIDGDDVTGNALILSEAHISWCHARYRSYSPDDNSYVSYQGDMRTCVSPHVSTPAPGAGEQAGAMLVQEMAGGAAPVAINSAHTQNCLQRYRSYRAEDNSYQPYGGGARRQCELRSF